MGGGTSFGGITMTSRTKAQPGTTGWSTQSNIGFTGNITTVKDVNNTTLTVSGTGPHNGTWPRVVASGNTIHMIYAVNNSNTTSPSTVKGVIFPFVYSRSLDGGLTWDKENILLPGLDTLLANSVRRVGGDSYAIHANGNTVAISAGGYNEDPWTIWKSTDNGSTWSSPKVLGDITNSDTLNITTSTGPDTVGFMPDGVQAILVDNSGTVHAFSGQVAVVVERKPGTTNGWQMKVDPVNNTISYFAAYSDGILYWNDGALTNMRKQVIAFRENIFPTGNPRDWVGAGGATTPARPAPYSWWTSRTSFPNAAVDANNNVYLVYSSVVEGTGATGTPADDQSTRDLYLMKGQSITRGYMWSKPLNIARDIANPQLGDSTGTDYEEDIYPSVVHAIGNDNILHMTWMMDYEPGIHLQGDLDDEVENYIMYYGINVSTVNFDFNSPLATVLGTNENMALAKGVVAYPNPTTGNVTITLGDMNAAKAEIKVVNVMGQTVNVPVAKTGNAFNLDLSNVANGVYIYTITSDNGTVTSRIVKN